ncbi:MATE family efflux transporter [Zophobihabitans entericus]|uniref:MATE family efflux transporter n=1 Tax=Zophobihabitans entericus TaxID=1635327 RepID=A0A6G9I856_9GAMM|nr:MATE family efflux transporter [Zophobihabitans entericus]QIQ20393.1 MATE family efflux transporter [Zophobihabitans entericus]
MKNSNSVTEQSLFSLSWPIFIDIFLHLATLFINTYMISHVSLLMVSATTVGNQFFDIFIPIFNFIGIGCSVVIAQYLGAGNREQARKAIHISIAFNFILSLFCYLFISLCGYQVLIWMNTPANLLQMSYDYFHILGICLIFEAIVIIIASCIRVYGKSKAVMYVSLIMNVVTVFGNILVLYGFFGIPQMGLVGVAWSTVIGRIIGIILLFCLLVYGLRIKLEISLFFHWSKDLLKKIFKIGLPSAGENLSWSGQCLVMTAFIGLMGEIPLAAQAIYFQIAYFMMLFSIAIGIGNEIIVGHMVGAKRFDDAYHRTFKSLRFGFIITAFVVLGFFLIRVPLLTAFTDNTEVLEILLPIFILAIFLEPGRTLNITMVNALRATGDARFPFITALVFMWGLAIPVGYILGVKMGMGLLGIWIGFACDEWVRGLVNTWRWKSRRWQAKRLDI